MPRERPGEDLSSRGRASLLQMAVENFKMQLTAEPGAGMSLVVLVGVWWEPQEDQQPHGVVRRHAVAAEDKVWGRSERACQRLD